MRTASLLSVGLIGFTGAPVWGQTVTTIEPLRHSEFVQDRVKSSSDLVVGAVFAGQEKAETLPRFRATIDPGMNEEVVCLRTRSTDGFYASEYEYQVPDDWVETALLEFAYPTEHVDLVSDLPGPTLAVAATWGSCDSTGGNIIVGSWNTDDSGPDKPMIIALNTAGGSRAHIFVGAGFDAPVVECVPVEADRTTGFDFTCTLPALSGNDDVATVEDDTGRALIPIEVHVTYNMTPDPPRTEYLQGVR